MKNINKHLRKIVSFCTVAISVAVLFVSCNNDNWDKDFDSGYYMALGTLKKSNNEIYLVEDNDSTIYMKNISDVNDTLQGKRVFIEFFKYKKELSDPKYNITASVNKFVEDVLTKPYFEVNTQKENDSIGYDKIRISDAWITGKYVNFIFEYTGSSNVKHLINLVKNNLETQDKDNKIHLEFRHNALNDSDLYVFKGIVSFDARKLLENLSSATLRIKYQNFGSGFSYIDLDYNSK